MQIKHSFFVIEESSVKSMEALLKYLGEKIFKGRLCIYCNNHKCHDFKDGESVQKHMVRKGGIKIFANVQNKIFKNENLNFHLDSFN